jgi:hypothetical protein
VAIQQFSEFYQSSEDLGLIELKLKSQVIPRPSHVTRFTITCDVPSTVSLQR